MSAGLGQAYMFYKLQKRNSLKFFFNGWVITITIVLVLLTATIQLMNKVKTDSLPAKAAFTANVKLQGNYRSSRQLWQPVSDTSFSQPNPYAKYPSLAKMYSADPEKTDQLVAKTQAIIYKYRSMDYFDSKFMPPVQAETYIDVSLNYNAPLHLMLAIARSESRFGTDCYTSSGNMGRICKYKNIFSIGLTSKGSIGFETWEQGVEAFGKLYQKRRNLGYNDDQFLKIYNPYDEYVIKIKTLSAQFENQLNSPIGQS